MRLFVLVIIGLFLETLVCPMNHNQINALPQDELKNLVRITRKVWVRVTGYSPYSERCVGRWAHVWPRRTATNTDAEKPGLGADLRVFPKGTVICLPGIATLTVDDTGSAAVE